MRCCVTGCKNDSRRRTKSQGITFHVIPMEPGLRSAWLQALGKESWEPKERSLVCSDHFLLEDLYETRGGGRRKVRPGALPIILQDTENSDYEDLAALSVCRICLTVDGKSYHMRNHKLEQAYEHLTRVPACTEDNMPQQLCVECAQRLLNCSRFRTKALRANTLLTKILKKDDVLTTKNLKKINRENNQLKSSLVSKIFASNHYDVIYSDEIHKELSQTHTDEITDEERDNDIFTEVYDHEKEVDINDFESGKPVSFTDIEVKNESSKDSIFLNEHDGIYIPKEVVNSEEVHPCDNVGDVDVEILKEEYIEIDNTNTDVVESSTDDELPRSILRRRLEEQRKKGKTKVVKEKKEKKDPSEPKIDRRRKPFFNNDLSETLFSICDLTFEEQVAEIDKRKESSNYKNGVYKCEECYKGFLDEDAFNSHMSRHTNESGSHRCGICKTHFRHAHALRKHVTAHHTQRFSCRRCAYRTTHRQSARLHERWHNGTTYACPHCPDMFVKFTTYMGHIRIKHPSDFVCQLCGFSFVSEKGISLHKRLKHRQDLQIPDDGPCCELCNLRFIDSSALKRHISVSARHSTLDKEARAPNKPTKERRVRRERDKKDEEQRTSYPSQIRRAEGPIPCEQCGLQLEDSRAYHSHFRRMHPDKNRTKYPSMKSPCMCEVCGRMFQSYALLKDHRWVHTGERPFSCDACGKSFRMKQRLVAHRRLHSAHKPTFGCSLCGKQFSTQSNRQRHMFIHTGLKPFKCEMCGKGFKHASEKRAHITYVHLKKPWPKRSRGKRRVDPRQVPMQSSSAIPPGDIGLQPIWPACDPKMQHGHDKPPYYALKM